MAQSSNSINTNSIKNTGLGDVVRLLPTGTVFIFQFLNPVFTNNGHCGHVLNKLFTSILIVLCGISCFFSTFTDSYTDSGITHYGIATFNGIWPSSGSETQSAYKLRKADHVHAFFSLIVFAIVSLMDSNTVKCFYPSFESTNKVLLMALPPIVGSISSAVFMFFPNTRHGIGYLSTSSFNSSQSRS